MPRHFPVIFPSSETRTSRIEKTSRTSHSSRQSHSSCKGSSEEGERGFETTHGRVEGFGLIRQVTGFRQGRGRKPLRSFRACHERGNKHLGSMGAKLSRTSSAEVRYLKPIGKPRFSAFFFRLSLLATVLLTLVVVAPRPASGRYTVKDSDLKKLKKRILAESLAPFYPGVDADEEDGECLGGMDGDAEECPICLLSYPALNRSKCCGKGICTECFLQLKVSKKGSGSTKRRLEQTTQCPFCKAEKYDVAYRGKKSLAEKSAELEEERKVKEARQRWLEGERERDREIARKTSLESSSAAPSPSSSQPGETRVQYGSQAGAAELRSLSQPVETATAVVSADQQHQQPRHNRGISDYVPQQFQELVNVLIPDVDIDELMLNQAILESLQESGERQVDSATMPSFESRLGYQVGDSASSDSGEDTGLQEDSEEETSLSEGEVWEETSVVEAASSRSSGSCSSSSEEVGGAGPAVLVESTECEADRVDGEGEAEERPEEVMMRLLSAMDLSNETGEG